MNIVINIIRHRKVPIRKIASCMQNKMYYRLLLPSNAMNCYTVVIVIMIAVMIVVIARNIVI